MTSVQLPIELVHRIGWVLGGTDLFVVQAIHPDNLRQTKHELGACSLTCKYWAARIRPLIFTKLAIRSREDALAFIHLCHSATPGTSVGAFVKFLTLNQSAAECSWVHHILVIQPKDLIPNITEIDLHIRLDDAPDAVDDSEQPTLRSPYPGIPRPFPSGACRHLIGLLDFTNVRVRRFEDTICLTDLPEIGIVTFQTLKCAAESDAAAPLGVAGTLRRKKRRTPIAGTSVRGAAKAWPYVALAVTTRLSAQGSSNKPLFVNTMELPRIASIVIQAIDNCSCTVCKATESQDRSLEVLVESTSRK